jgi:hypothetical protein
LNPAAAIGTGRENALNRFIKLGRSYSFNHNCNHYSLSEGERQQKKLGRSCSTVVEHWTYNHKIVGSFPASGIDNRENAVKRFMKHGQQL